MNPAMALGADAKIKLLKEAPLFEQCSKQELKQIAGIADELDLSEGKVLIREGERGREFFVIVSGEVEVRRKGRKMSTLGAGSYVGEIALLSQIPRTATVTATTPLDVLVITDRAFLNLLEKSPTIAVKVARTLAERVGRNEVSDLRNART
jgi:CRP/FNR family cyclic AMP-dependent transcriptional regulator